MQTIISQWLFCAETIWYHVLCLILHVSSKCWYFEDEHTFFHIKHACHGSRQLFSDGVYQTVCSCWTRRTGRFMHAPMDDGQVAFVVVRKGNARAANCGHAQTKVSLKLQIPHSAPRSQCTAVTHGWQDRILDPAYLSTTISSHTESGESSEQQQICQRQHTTNV